MLSKFRGAATRMVVQAIQQNSANQAARFAGQRGSESAHCNNISHVMKEYGNQRLFPNFPDLPNSRLNITQPKRFFETEEESYSPPLKMPTKKPLYPQEPTRLLPFALRSKTESYVNFGDRQMPTTTTTTKTLTNNHNPNNNNQHNQNINCIIKQRPRNGKPTPGPPPRCDPILPKRMLTPRYKPKSVQSAMLALPSLSQLASSQPCYDMIWPETQRTDDLMPNLPYLPQLDDMPPRKRTGMVEHCDVIDAIDTAYNPYTTHTLTQSISTPCYENANLRLEEAAKKRRNRPRRLKGC